MVPVSTPQALELKKLLAQKIKSKRQELWDWHIARAKVTPPPFYCSVDLRDSGYKIAPVDSNLYPAGFNNICPDDLRAAPSVIRAQLEAAQARLNLPELKKILIVPESHTSNSNYIENLHYLNQLLTQAGFETRLGWYGKLPEGATNPFTLKSATDKTLQAHELEVVDGLLRAGDFTPDVILLNNDFSGGYPKLLDSIRQPILPSHTLGWHSRKKSEHFKYYNQLAAEFAAIAGFDPWIIQVDTEEVNDVDFNENVGSDRVAEATSRVLKRTQEAYARHGIKTPPFVFVKNNAGTYGMGIMVVHSADELLTMNRRTKNKMSVGKNRMAINSVAVQEGIPTATIVDRLAAEPVIYLVGCELIGGFLRTNTERGIEDNLNSQGMVFRKLCMSDLKRPASELNADPQTPDSSDDSDDSEEEPLLELVYGSIARISALATGMELAAQARAGSPAPVAAAST